MIYFANIAVGGPIKRDTLWFFGSYGNNGNNNIVANSFYPDGSPGIYDQRAENRSLRLTWQANPKHKITAYGDIIKTSLARRNSARRRSRHGFVEPEVQTVGFRSSSFPIQVDLAAEK